MALGKDFGARFKEARENKGLSQKAVGKAIGKHYHRVLAYEKGSADLDTAAELAAAIDVPLVELLFPGDAKTTVKEHSLPECVRRVSTAALGAIDRPDMSHLPPELVAELAKLTPAQAARLYRMVTQPSKKDIG